MENTSPETTAKVLSNKASNQIERAASGMQQMVESATDTALAASRTAGRWTEATRERVRRNPFTSIGIAVGVAVGMALGAEYLYHRRERHWHSH